MESWSRSLTGPDLKLAEKTSSEDCLLDDLDRKVAGQRYETDRRSGFGILGDSPRIVGSQFAEFGSAADTIRQTQPVRVVSSS